MEDRLASLRTSLGNALDDLSSPRSSTETQAQALQSLEKILAFSVVPRSSTEDLDYFLALQYTFECNVPSRILSWIASSTRKLDLLISKETSDSVAESEAATLSSQLALSLFIVQGVCLTHAATKTYLGRKYTLEVLLDLFLSSRHLSSAPSAPDNPSGSPVKATLGAPLPLASVVLDTLLCILVDSSPALRVFEACQGVQAVVKILKRAGTPREVRMKCLEFLYFYLLDETDSSKTIMTPTPAPTAPSTPQQPAKKPFINATPARPISRYGSSTFSLTSSSFAGSSFASSSDASSSSASSASSSRSTSGSPTSSFSSTSSNVGSTSPKKRAQLLPAAQMPRPQPRALMMLRKDLDFVPLSPKKTPGDQGAPARSAVRGRSRLASDEAVVPQEEESTIWQEAEDTRASQEAKTTEEKKELLATMLGNVEALVEGVRKAGIWGLG
ncbi:cell division control protein 14, SIN component-domain-containing protein [Mycena pura]|uniref:Cell division control protein 14, SIN component-domain-containing protein n=1 Tax=Mycena pura TaxID=153505 RepID=A0AAD6V9T3_9AGAR|nr:cell division control protein 14, SIN component-domain-containing protein [Mycena pura]